MLQTYPNSPLPVFCSPWTLALGLVLVGLIACKSSEPSAPAPKKSVSEKPVLKTPAEPTPKAGESPDALPKAPQKTRYILARAQSSLQARRAGREMENLRAFQDFSGELWVNDKGLPVEFSLRVKVGSLKSPDEGIQKLFAAPQGLWLETFPEAVYKSKSIYATTSGASHQVSGTLELRGKGSMISFPATVKVEGDTAVLEGKSAFNLKRFGVTKEGAESSLLEGGVLVKMKLAFVKEGAVVDGATPQEGAEQNPSKTAPQ